MELDVDIFGVEELWGAQLDVVAMVIDCGIHHPRYHFRTPLSQIQILGYCYYHS
jgi:hypothetical protein